MKYTRRLFALAVVLAAASVLARTMDDTPVTDKVAWLKQNAVAIRPVEARDGNYDDLAPFGRAIGNARVVMLGGARSVNVQKLKLRLVRFLHEQQGFDVLACPVDFFDGEEMDRAIERRAAPSFDALVSATAAPGNAPLGPRMFDLSPALEYSRHTHKTTRPLHFAGYAPFQTEIPSSYGKRLFAFIDSIDPQIASAADRRAINKILKLGRVQNINPFLTAGQGPSWYREPNPVPFQNALPAGLAALKNITEAFGRLPANRADARELYFYGETLSQVGAYAALRAHQPADAKAPDPLMVLAKLLWPQNKIVVWSNNLEAARVAKIRGRRGFTSVNSQGHDIATQFGTAVYSLGMTEVISENQVLEVLVAGPEPSLQPDPVNFESLVHSDGHPMSFVDFRALPPGHWLRQPLTARFFDIPETASWPLSFDGVINIDLTLAKAKK